MIARQKNRRKEYAHETGKGKKNDWTIQAG